MEWWMWLLLAWAAMGLANMVLPKEVKQAFSSLGSGLLQLGIALTILSILGGCAILALTLL